MRRRPTDEELKDREYWEDEARRILKGEMARRDLLYKTLAAKLSTDGIPVTEGMLKVKVNRGTFSFAFFLKLMRALGATSVDISRKDLPPGGPGRADEVRG